MESNVPMQSPCGERVESPALEHDSFPICAITSGAGVNWDIVMDLVWYERVLTTSGCIDITPIAPYNAYNWMPDNATEWEPGVYFTKIEIETVNTQGYTFGCNAYRSGSGGYGFISIYNATKGFGGELSVSINKTMSRLEGCQTWMPFVFFYPLESEYPTNGSAHLRWRGYQHGTTPNF